jgi:hypothetical protein
MTLCLFLGLELRVLVLVFDLVGLKGQKLYKLEEYLLPLWQRTPWLQMGFVSFRQTWCVGKKRDGMLRPMSVLYGGQISLYLQEWGISSASN